MFTDPHMVISEQKFMSLKINELEDIFYEAIGTLSWISGAIWIRSQSPDRSPCLYVLWNVCDRYPRFTSYVAPATILVASTTAEHPLLTYFLLPPT